MNDTKSPNRSCGRSDVDDVVRLLKDQAPTVMQTPPASLRFRTLSALRGAPARTVNAQWRWRIGAWAAAAVFALAASVSILVLLRGQNTVDRGSQDREPWKTLSALSNPSSPELRLTDDNPLAREARLIAKDAQHTVALLKRSLPATLKFDKRTGGMHGTSSESGVDGGV